MLIPFSIRKLQDDLTDEMVGLAQQLKESSLMMSQSLQNTEKVSSQNVTVLIYFDSDCCLEVYSAMYPSSLDS